MGRHSIKFKITLMLTIIISSLLVLLMILNSTMSEKFYLNGRRKQMLEGYTYINNTMVSYTGGTLGKDEMQDKIEQFASGAAISVIVINSDWTTLYTNCNGEAEMVERLRMSMFNRDVFGKQDSYDNSNIQDDKQQDDKQQPSDDDIKDDGKKFPMKDRNGGSLSINMEQSGIAEKREIIKETDKYTLQKVYDERLSDDYYELWGTLDNGCSIMMRVAIQGIKDNVSIFNKFVTYIGLVVLAAGIAAAYVLSGYISKPIKELSNLAERMADMDFDARYTGSDKGEIGILGKSMNNMSEKLEQNISQLKTANLELKKDIDKKEKLEQMRSDFLSNVSHELKTPIALIQGYAEGLKEGISDDPESMEFYCDVIIDESDKMNKMVKKLLALTQIEFGNKQVNIERFNLVDVMEGIIKSVQLRAEQENVKIIFENKEPVYVWADEFQIEEVITNYVSNAFNHIDGKRIIEMKIVEKDGIVRMSVFNTGKQIPENELENVWIKFYKVDKARTREYGGNGIGLSIVKAIADSMNKKCGVFNHEDGVEFWFELDGKASEEGLEYDSNN